MTQRENDTSTKPIRQRHPGEDDVMRRRAEALKRAITARVADVVSQWVDHAAPPDERIPARITAGMARAAALGVHPDAPAAARTAAAALAEDLQHPAQPLSLCERLSSIFAIAAAAELEPALVTVPAAQLVSIWELERDSRVGGLAELEPGRVQPGVLALDVQLRGLEAALAVAVTDPSARNKALALALLIAGRALLPGRAVVASQFWTEPPRDAEINVSLNIRAARLFFIAAQELDEPGFADLAERVLQSLWTPGAATPDVRGDDAPELLSALAYQYRRRPSAAVLSALERCWASLADEIAAGDPGAFAGHLDLLLDAQEAL